MNLLHNTLDRLNRLKKRHEGKFALFTLIFALVILSFASEDSYQDAKKSEQMVANYWKPDGNKHFSGIEE